VPADGGVRSQESRVEVSVKVWVSGASGFTGSALVSALNQRGDCVCASRCDILDGDAVDAEMREFSPDAVVHLAAISQPTHQPVTDFYAVHVVGTRYVLRAAAQLESRPRVILASSAHVYGRRAETHPTLFEDLTPEPTSHYALSKWAMEQLCSWFPNLEIIVFRPFNYTGRGQISAFLFPKIAEHLATKKPQIELGSLHAARDLSWIDDVIQVYLAALDSRVPCAGIYNVCSGVAQSIEDLVTQWIRVSKSSIEIIFSKELVRENEILSMCGSTERLRTTFGFVPRPLTVAMLNEIV